MGNSMVNSMGSDMGNSMGSDMGNSMGNEQRYGQHVPTTANSNYKTNVRQHCPCRFQQAMLSWAIHVQMQLHAPATKNAVASSGCRLTGCLTRYSAGDV